MELSIKSLVSVILTFIIVTAMILFFGMFVNLSAKKIELEGIVSAIEVNSTSKEEAERLIDRDNVSVDCYDVADKYKCEVIVETTYKTPADKFNQVKLKGYTKVLENVGA